MNKTVIATAAAVMVISMSACGPASGSNEEIFRNDVVTSMTLDVTNRSREAASKILSELKKTDPSIESVEPTAVNGRETLTITRNNNDGTYDSWTMDPFRYAEMLRGSQPQQVTDGGSGMGGALMGAAAGIIAGGLLANMFNSSAGSNTRYSGYNNYLASRTGQRQAYSSYAMSNSSSLYEKEREKERRSSGARPYISPFISQAATASAHKNGVSNFTYKGVANTPAPSAPKSTPSSYSSGGRSSSSSQAFSSGARGSAGTGG